MGGVISAPAISAILKGCAAKPDINWKPVFLSNEQAAIVEQVAEIILPKTTTPGAKDVGVPAFIDKVLSEVYSKEDQTRFLDGLKAFDESADKEAGDAFAELDQEDQVAFVKKKHDEAIEAEKSGAQKQTERPFILTMKELTMLGFFTSKVGASEVLQYDPVPGAYHGCIPVNEAGNGKTWAS